MSKNRLLFYSILIISILSFCSFKCFADSRINVTANVDKTKISLDEVVQFRITIEGISGSYDNPKIKLPRLEDNFSIVATSQSNSINLIGNNLEINWQMQYTLSPKKEGQIKIESAEIIFKKRSYETQEIIITVTPAKIPQKIPRQETPSQKVPWSRKEGISI